MVKNKVLIIRVLLFLSALISFATQAANITVTTSRNPVALDDSFHLIYEADSSVDDDPDFSPVSKNFDILSSSQSTNMRSINGNWSLKKTWDLSVIAKDIGRFTIPAINFGRDISPAIQVTVKNSTSPNSASPKGQAIVPAKIFLESSIDKKSGWVQAQFVYTIRLLRTVGIAGASLTEPDTSDADAIIEKLSEDNYQTTRGKIRYEVFERSYAIFPQKSGALKINPITFEGRINATQPRSIFDQFRMSGQLKRLRSKAINITVKAAPKNINLQDWLPANDLQLIEEWSDDIQNIKAGEPVTRTIIIGAEGLTGVQLPELNFADIDGLKQYPDKAIIENRQSSAGITGLKQIKIALIPTSAGTYTLPEIKLQWWNTKTNKKEIATIPETILTATGSVSTVAPTEIKTPLKEQPAQAINNATPPATTVINNEPYWKWLTAFFAFAWLYTLILLINKSRTNKIKNSNKTEASTTSVKSAISVVEKNARKNNANKTKTALIVWAQRIYNDKDLTNLTQITEHCSTELAHEIRMLNETLYSPEKPSWNGKGLLKAFNTERLLNNKQNNEQTSALKPLYSG